MRGAETGDSILRKINDISYGRRSEVLAGDTIQLTSEARELLKRDSGLVELDNNRYTVGVADVHARPDMVVRILSYRYGFSGLPDQPLISHIINGDVNIVFLGDYSHSEDPKAWMPQTEGFKLLDAVSQELFSYRYKQFLKNGKLADTAESIDKFWASKSGRELMESDALKIRQKEYEMAMTELGKEEVNRWVLTWNLLMNLKIDAPNNVFLLRGNHDDMKGRVLSASKFNSENEVMRVWLIQNGFSEEEVNAIAATEGAMSLAARRYNKDRQLDLMLSHAFPRRVLTSPRILQNKSDEGYRVITTGDNRAGYIEKEDLEDMFEAQTRLFSTETGVSGNIRWVIGHRPIEVGNLSRKQLDGRLIQINDSKKYLMAIVPPDSKHFDSDRHIIDARYDVSESTRRRK